MSEQRWRVGEHYGIHVYEGDRPVATFHHEKDARLAVYAHNILLGPPTVSGDLDGMGSVGPMSDTPLADQADQVAEKLMRRMRRGER